MQWSDVTRTPSQKMLRQFAGLWLIVFLAMAGWRWYSGRPDVWSQGLAVLAVVVGGAGLIAPSSIKPIYVGWMIAAFPIGWTVSRLVLAAIFYVVLTPLAWVFRLSGRDALRRNRRSRDSYWMPKAAASGPRSYLRQS